MISKTFRLPSGTTQFEKDLVNRLDAILKDIADQFNITQAEPSMESPTSIVNAFSDGEYSIAMPYLGQVGKVILSGALTATEYKEVLAITDSGIVTLLAAVTADATSRTVGLKVVVDGVTVFDAVSDAMTTTNKGLMAVGSYTGATTSAMGFMSSWMPFNTSLSVQVKSSLGETDKVKLYVAYHLT